MSDADIAYAEAELEKITRPFRLTTCQYCGRKGLYLHEYEPNVWRLFTTDRKIHACIEEARRMYDWSQLKALESPYESLET